MVLERKVDDVKYTLRATETTIQNLRGLNGAVLTVEKPFGKAYWISNGNKSFQCSQVLLERHFAISKDFKF